MLLPDLLNLPSYGMMLLDLATVQSIPDGVRLEDFPSHWEDAQCWCRPKEIFVGDEVVFAHKDLAKGEFDS
jgi:hypothetical protein